MATLFRCDQCHYYQETPLPFAVSQITQELDEDSEPIVMAYDLCSPGCLSDFAMGLSLDFPDEGTTP